MTGWQRIDPGPGGAALRAICPGVRAWQREVEDGHLTVFAGPEPHPDFDRPLWHLSISHRTSTDPPLPGRYPSWDEVTDARYRFVPGQVTMAMLLPPRAEYINVHDTCFQLWEVEGEGQRGPLR